jgi:hypothetical protein
MPQELKKQLNRLSVFAGWLPLALPYSIARLAGASWHAQAHLSPPSPTPLIAFVKLSSITLETKTKKRFPRFSFVWRGNWDVEQTRKRCTIAGPCHEESPFRQDFETIRNLCRDNLPLDQIEEYHVVMAALEAGGNPRGCKSQAEVGDYFTALEKTNHSIATEGYKTSRELGGMVRDEISVWITRDGQLAYGGWANHRLAIADLHQIERVPVSILGSHPDWLIEQCRLNSLPPHLALMRWIETLR